MKTLLAIFIMSGSLIGQTAATAAATETKQTTEAERQSVAAVRFVRAKLNDPDSFRVSGVTARLTERKDGSSAYIVCINGRSKNRMGGYSPLVSYVLPAYQNNPMSSQIGNPDDSSASGTMNIDLVNIMCKEKKGDDTTGAAQAALRADRSND
jgi:hypothetical protein